MIALHNVLIDGVDVENYGGIEAFLCNYLPLIDHDIRFDIALSDEVPPFLQGLVRRNVGFVRIRRRRDSFLGNYHDCRKLIRCNHYDAVWIHKSSLSNTLLLSLAKAYDVPTRILHAHNASADSEGSLRKVAHALQRERASSLATHRWACSSQAGRFFFGTHPFDVVVNAFDVERFLFSPTLRKAVRSELGVGDSFVLGSVGRLVPIKNHAFLVSLMPDLLSLVPNAKLVIVGKGPLLRQMEELAQKLRVEKSVIFTGAREDVCGLLSALDAFVLPSFNEGLPFCVLEAQASGLPCFVSQSLSDAVPDFGNISYLSLDEEASWVMALSSCASESSAKDAGLRSVQPLALQRYDVSVQAPKLEAMLVDKLERGGTVA